MFDNTAAGKDGTLQSGDELIGVNGTSVKGRTKVEVAKIIQAVQVRVRRSRRSGEGRFTLAAQIPLDEFDIRENIAAGTNALWRKECRIVRYYLGLERHFSRLSGFPSILAEHIFFSAFQFFQIFSPKKNAR